VRLARNNRPARRFHSAELDADASCLVWLPRMYDQAQNRRYPVIYWLHGRSGNQRTCAEQFLPHYLSALRDRFAPPCIVVAVNGIQESYYCDSADGLRPVESVITKDLIPNIDASFRTIARREGRVIEGFSMGGMGTARLGFKYPELFGTVIVNSAGPLGEEAFTGPLLQHIHGGDAARGLAEHPAKLVEKNAHTLRQTHIRLGCGENDPMFEKNRDLHDTLERLGVEHRWLPVPGVAHDPPAYYRTLGHRGFAFHQRALANLGK
jgi:enterochelin esterase-like enzyme